MALLTMDLLARVTTGTKLGMTWTRDHHVSACLTYKQGMKAIGFFLEDEDASEIEHEDFMRGVIANFGSRCFFCNLEGQFQSDCP